MTFEKLVSRLNAHGVCFYKHMDADIIHAYCYSNSNDYDVLKVIGGQVYINGIQSSLSEWLGY